MYVPPANSICGARSGSPLLTEVIWTQALKTGLSDQNEFSAHDITKVERKDKLLYIVADEVTLADRVTT